MTSFEPTNFDRAGWADRALRVFCEQTGCDCEDCLGDLLTDLMHWAAMSRLDFDAALFRARDHYLAEVEEGGAA